MLHLNLGRENRPYGQARTSRLFLLRGFYCIGMLSICIEEVLGKSWKMGPGSAEWVPGDSTSTDLGPAAWGPTDWVMHNVTVVALRCQFGIVHRTTPELRYPTPTNPFYITPPMFADLYMRHCPFQSLVDREKP